MSWYLPHITLYVCYVYNSAITCGVIILYLLFLVIVQYIPVSSITQVLAGIYPIAQLREPYTTVGYLAERIPLTSLLKVTHPEAGERKEVEEREPPRWSATDICDG